MPDKTWFRDVLIGVAAAVISAGVIGAVGYYGFIIRLDERVTAVERTVKDQKEIISTMQTDRADLKATLQGMTVELRNINMNLARLEQRLRDQENRSWDDRRYQGGGAR